MWLRSASNDLEFRAPAHGIRAAVKEILGVPVMVAEQGRECRTVFIADNSGNVLRVSGRTKRRHPFRASACQWTRRRRVVSV